MSVVIDVARFVALSSAAALIGDALHRFLAYLDGIPKRLRDLNQKINRPGFTFNPTSCDPMTITGSIGGWCDCSYLQFIPGGELR